MLDGLAEKFSGIFNRLKGYGKLTEANISEALREVRLALLESDVHVRVVKNLLEQIKAKSLGSQVTPSLHPDQQFLKIVHEELVAFLGGMPQEVSFSGKPPHVILLCGLQGSGKTTTAAKLALFYKKKGRSPYLIPADLARPAAIDQLKTLAQKIDCPCFDPNLTHRPAQVVEEGIAEAKNRYCDLVIVDTAGRLHVDSDLMEELKDVATQVPNSKILFVVDAMMGQEAVRVTTAFHELLKLDGAILTKLDGDARGGAVLSLQHVAQCPIYFVGMGEKLEDLEPFHPDRLVNRLLDRGDLLALVDRAKTLIQDSEVLKSGKKILKDQFTLEDFRTHLRQAQKLGSMGQLLGMIPGGKALAKKVNLDDAQRGLKIKEAILNSMTREERLHPEILNGTRRLRISGGCGCQVSEINRFLKEFAQIKKMMKQFSQGGLKQWQSLFG